jgi:hypothetical protein
MESAHGDDIMGGGITGNEGLWNNCGHPPHGLLALGLGGLFVEGVDANRRPNMV